MHDHTPIKKAHGCDPVSFTDNTTNDLNFPTGQREGKAFATLAARFALAGHTLTHSNPADGAVLYYAGRSGKTRELANLDAVAFWLDRVTGVKL